MIRLVLSIIILAALITFVILPMMKHIRKGIKSGGEIIDKALTEELESPKGEEPNNNDNRIKEK